MLSLLYALILTIILEGITMLLLTRSFKWVYYNLLCNMVTNPTLNLLLYLIAVLTRNRTAYYTGVAIGELLVLVGEMYIYKAITGEGTGKCAVRSAVTNIVSFTLGLVINTLI